MPLARIEQTSIISNLLLTFAGYQTLRSYPIYKGLTYRFSSAHKSHSTLPCCIARFHVANYDCYRARIRRVGLSVPPRKLRLSIAIPKVIWVFQPWTLRRMTRFDRIWGFGRKSLPAEVKLFFAGNLASPTTFYPFPYSFSPSLFLHRTLKMPPFITVKWRVFKMLSHAAFLLHLRPPANFYLFFFYDNTLFCFGKKFKYYLKGKSHLMI